ncbi:ABC transporter substrate-binding protein [Vreelandella maris]|uniref:Iron-siderophore ABC transporter substrate-binding protein n=1 Tax=Vreelandella maris TaxID=2729617 RepID=A0A7Y6V6U6_9GAMM|nr:iron-siderophore ABC transporter substrate-binding protein [Halomonas maris]NVF12569.1 iron-siderophore ABC transporter substrate-binding protein [Halomonas maris]|tara:strand:+ start:108 stop:1085 length:978 start_codon:yes stop_codon:yes gene_type:complete
MQTAHFHRCQDWIRVLLVATAALFPLFAPAAPLHASTESPRVVTLYQGATDSAIALGLTPIGVVDSWLEKPMYRYLRDPLASVEHVGLETQPNLEKIAWLNPDLVIASDFRHASIAPLLTAIAPTVSAPTVFNFKTTLTIVADASGRQAEASELLQRWEKRTDDFSQQIATKLGSDWPQKVAVVRFKSDHVRIYTRGFAGSILTELGFAQPETLPTQGWGMKLTSTENIPVLEADVLFILLEPDDPAIADNYQHWQGHPLWQQLSAVQHGRVFEVDPVSWMMGGGILAANAMLDDLYTHYGLVTRAASPLQECRDASINAEQTGC